MLAHMNRNKIITKVYISEGKNLYITPNGTAKIYKNIAKSEQSSHTPGGCHQRPYHFDWKERKMDK